MPLGCCWGGVTRRKAESVCMVCSIAGRERSGPTSQRPAHAPIPRGEGAGLSAPAAAAKQEQLAQHCKSPYQFEAGGRSAGGGRLEAVGRSAGGGRLEAE